ncbi:efflux RND transporter permease subunit, partial [bacterium]
FVVFIELASGVQLDIANKVAKETETLIKETKDVSDIIKSMSTKTEGWSTKIYITLMPRADRNFSTPEVIDKLRKRLKNIGKDYDGFVYFSEPQQGKELFLDLYGYDYSVLAELAMQMASRLSKVEGLTDVKIRYKPGRPQLTVSIIQNKAAFLGLKLKEIAESIHGKMRGLRATELRSKGEEIEAVVRLFPEQRETLKQLKNLSLVTKINNKTILFPLEHISKFIFDLAPSEIWHRNKTRMIQVSANIGKMALEEAAQKSLDTAKGLSFPKGYYVDVGGDYDDLIASQKGFRKAVLMTIFLVFLVLACIFESVVQPFIIMFTVLLSAFGAICALVISKVVVSSGVLIGFLMLAGIVVNNGIILVSSINTLLKKETSHNLSFFDIIKYASKKRIQPVLMTTATTVCGLIPMVLDRSESAVLWRPFAITVIGGLITSTILTLFIVPMMYYVGAGKLERREKSLKQWDKQIEPEPLGD